MSGSAAAAPGRAVRWGVWGMLAAWLVAALFHFGCHRHDEDDDLLLWRTAAAAAHRPGPSDGARF